jgi:prepilin-type N-terminal cleavage/methylation domain-containing protein
MNTHKTQNHGVTLVEILVVIAIIFILVVITLPAFKNTPAGYPAGTSITRIDGCEYIESGIFDNFTRTHKGNCDNPIHFQNKILEK